MKDNDTNIKDGDQLQNDGQEQKTFTQEEVDEIVRKRLARERKKADQDNGASSGSDREKTLDERELKIMAKEKLHDSGLPINLADILRYSDEESLDNAIEEIKNMNKGAPKAWGQRVSRGGGTQTDPYRKAMGLSQ